MSPLVSIVISVYNGADYLPRCTQAILAQTLPDWECLLVDDGSPDGVTPALCDEIAQSDPRFRAYHKENEGPDSGCWYGAQRARGQWIFYVDQDDLLPSYAIATALRAQEEYPHSMLLWRWCEDTADFVPPPTDGPLPVQLRRLEESGQMYMESLLYFTWGRLFSRDILLKYKIAPPPGVAYGGDLIFCMEYIRACAQEGFRDYAVLQTPLYFYETHNSQSVTTRLRPTYCDDELKTTAYLLKGFGPPLDIPERDFGRVLQSCMRTLAEGYGYVLYREEALSADQRVQKIKGCLHSQTMQELLAAFKAQKLYSPYRFWLAHGVWRPACWLAERKAVGSRWYDRLYWAGYWLHSLLTGKKDEPYL